MGINLSEDRNDLEYPQPEVLVLVFLLSAELLTSARIDDASFSGVNFNKDPTDFVGSRTGQLLNKNTSCSRISIAKADHLFTGKILFF